jgi:two-component system phosphate regulon response regulator OmpR
MTAALQDDAPHILVVDDDERLRALLKQYLGEQGFFVSTAAQTREAEELMAAFAVDAMVLDVMMPGETGLAYAARLKDGNIPVLLLTARGEVEDRIAGLEAGAADYLAKPFAPRELLLRLENLLARNQKTNASARSVGFGDYMFELASGRLSRSGEAIYLTSSESDCLKILAASAGTAVSREQIAGSLGDVGNVRSVDVQINRLRKKIEPQPGKPVYLQTVRHAGYVLYADPL